MLGQLEYIWRAPGVWTMTESIVHYEDNVADDQYSEQVDQFQTKYKNTSS